MHYARHNPSPLLYLVMVWIITRTVAIPVGDVSSNVLGYNSITGKNPLCWRSVQPVDIDMISIPLPCQNVTLNVQSPAVNESYRILRTGKEYDYPVEIRIPHLDESTTNVGVKLLFCVAGQVGFCSPFILDEAWTTDNVSSYLTHVESETMWINTLEQSSLEVNITLTASLPKPGEYFPIVIVQYFNHIFRWDIANALPPGSRLLTLQSPAHTSHVSDGVRIFSFVAIGISSAIITWLLWQTIKHRKQPVLSLSQADFLIVFLFAALVATVSTFLLQPHSDLYCQMSSPMILIPVQLMYSITLGRLWRIQAVLSPLLLEQYRKKLRHRMMWRIQVLQCLNLLARIPQQVFKCRFKASHPEFLQVDRPPSQRIAVRRSVNSKQLSLVVLFFVFPQVVLQICSVILQPHSLQLIWNSELSDVTPQCSNGQIWYTNILNYAYAALMLLMLTLMVMAFSSRKLPSLFNETSVIYQTAANTLVLILVGLIVIGVTTSDGINTTTRARNPSIQYLVWVTVLLSITLGSSIRLMIPKLKMVWRGETVVVSKLVSDHHHKERKRYKESVMSASTTKLMHNVTGLDLEEDTQRRPPSRRNSSRRSVDTNASSDYFDTLTPLTVDERGAKAIAEVPGLTLPLPFDDDGRSNRELGKTNRRSFMEIEATFGNGLQIQDGDSGGRPSFNRQRTTREVLTAAAADVDRRKMFLKKRSSRSEIALPKIVVSPEETPPRRLVLKMVDLQEELAAVNKNIMSGLAVKTEAWDAVVDLVTRIEKNFREDVVFSWRPPAPDPIVTPTDPLNSSSLACLQEVEEEDSDHRGVDDKNPILPKSPGSKSSSFQSSNGLSLRRLERKFRRIVDVRERKYKRIKYGDSFVGSEAVDAMVYNGLASSRTEAVALGRKLATERRLFQHVTNEHDFHDKSYLYRFLDPDNESLSSLCEEEDDDDYSSTGECSFSDDKTNIKDQALRFLEVVNVSNRNYQGKQYQNVFVGSEAIDAMVYHGIAATRWESVQLGRKFARDLSLFQHVHGEFELRDEFLLYKFRDDVQESMSCAEIGPEGLISTSLVTSQKSPLAQKADAFRTYVDVRDRRFRMQKCKKTFVGQEAVDAAIFAGLAKTREEAVHLGRMLQRELRLFHCVSGDRPFEDGLVFYRFRDDSPDEHPGQDPFTVERSATSLGNNNRQRNVRDLSEMPLASLSEQVQYFKEIVPVSDRTHHFRKFSNVFVGCEAIDAMVFYGMAHTREEAVQLGRVLAREAGLFKHASHKNRYAFCDEFLLYQYTSNATSVSIDGDIMDEQSMSTGSLKLERAGLHKGAKPRGELGMKAELFRSCVDVRDRTYRMVKYKSCFIGSEAVDAMLFVGLAENREKAVEIGRMLATQLRLFRPCIVGARTSFDDAFVFYRFDERFEDMGLHSSFNDFSHDPSIDNTIVSRAQLLLMAEKFRACAVVKDRKLRFRSYRQCFMGAETVNALVDSGVVGTHKEAVEYGRTLARELNLFRCVMGDYAFANDAILYAFVRDVNMNAYASAEFSDQSFGSYNSRSTPGEFGDRSVLNATEQGDGSGNLPILFEVEASETGGDIDMIPLEIIHDSSHDAPV